LNIRNYIGNTKTNNAIIKTANEEPKEFFLFNNGISCLATKVELKEDAIQVSGLQVINGALTVKALLHVSKDIRRWRKPYWDEGSPLIVTRITEVPSYGSGSKMRERITQFNNTQNPVKISDFRSNDRVQANVKKQFAAMHRKGKKVVYVAKRTDRAGANTEVIKLEEYAKSVYTFLYDYVPFSGSTSFLFDDEATGGYNKVFGDGKLVWDEMPENEFRLRAAISWIAQEVTTYLRNTRSSEPDPDARAALERKWPLIFAVSVVARYCYGEQWTSQVERLYRGDWTMEETDKKGQVVLQLYSAARSGLIMAYKNAKTNAKENFVHRNWMRGKDTPTEIRGVLESTLLPLIPKIGQIPS
jgi:AIPR protein